MASFALAGLWSIRASSAGCLSPVPAWLPLNHSQLLPPLAPGELNPPWSQDQASQQQQLVYFLLALLRRAVAAPRFGQRKQVRCRRQASLAMPSDGSAPQGSAACDQAAVRAECRARVRPNLVLSHVRVLLHMWKPALRGQDPRKMEAQLVAVGWSPSVRHRGRVSALASATLALGKFPQIFFWDFVFH